jgi:hypothetical protein
MGGVVAPAICIGRFGHDEILFKQRLYGGGCGITDYAILCSGVARREQPGGLRRLAQQFDAGTLAQFFWRQDFARRM